MNFWKNEDGNTNVDWVVVTAGVVMLGAALGVAISASASDVSGDIGTGMDSMDPASISTSY